MAFKFVIATVALYCTLLVNISALPTATTTTTATDDNTDDIDTENPDASYELYQLPSTLQLPKLAAAPVPFYAAEPSTELKAPQYISIPEPTYYEIPVPAQDLRAPSETAWNPNNDPKYYYELPAILTRQELPTNIFPKKFNKDIHIKDKPYASKPKQEIILTPIDEKQLMQKQKNLDKTYDSLAKTENRKDILQLQQTI